MIKITARNFKLTEGISDNIHSKLGKFTKFADESINVILESNKYGKKIEVSFKLASKPVRASVIDNDLYIAIDLLADKVTEIVHRNKGKNNVRKIEKDNINFAMLDNSVDLDETLESTQIIKRKFISLKPMYEEEAIEQMELLDHRSFIFHNANTNTVCMLYKRHDGNYGILETE